MGTWKTFAVRDDERWRAAVVRRRGPPVRGRTGYARFLMGEREPVLTLRWVDAEDRRFLRLLASELAAGARVAGLQLVCRIGCTDCCVGSFPITQLDARRLRAGLAALGEADPVRAGAVLARARTAIAERDLEGPCPALDPETGACDLYASRPVTCRTYGPPVRIGTDRLPPCRLCFTSAPQETIERARVTIDAAGDEQAMLTALERAGIPDENTTVADTLVGSISTDGSLSQRRPTRPRRGSRRDQ